MKIHQQLSDGGFDEVEIQQLIAALFSSRPRAEVPAHVLSSLRLSCAAEVPQPRKRR
jgi:hypothetical protein